MKNTTDKKKNLSLIICESLAFLLTTIALVSIILPAYTAGTETSYTLAQLVFGTSLVVDFNPWLIFAFSLLIISSLTSLLNAVNLLFKVLDDEMITTILGIVGGLFSLVGGSLLACSVLITGLDKLNSELGFIQGNWAFGIANYLVFAFSFFSFCISYPAALVIPSRLDKKDDDKRKALKISK